MKSVLISIQPKWCELIANGGKTIEVRKTKPKIDTPFKCYIYQTKKPVSVSFSGTGRHISEYDKNCYYNERSGKVIGEFVCDYIDDMRDVERKPTCLTINEWLKYTDGHKGTVWGWHISDLVIYDKPKELSEFKGLRKTKFGYAPYDITRPPQSWCYVEGKEDEK